MTLQRSLVPGVLQLPTMVSWGLWPRTALSGSQNTALTSLLDGVKLKWSWGH